MPSLINVYIDVDVLMSKLENATEQEFQQAWRQWPVPQNRTKFDVTFMELYFTSMTAQVPDKAVNDILW